MEKVIYLNAGHDLYIDRGVTYNNVVENEEAIKICDILTPLLERHFKVKRIPDQHNLQDSVKWVNGGAYKLSDGLALSLHLNSDPKHQAGGAECFHHRRGYLLNKPYAKKLIDKYCEITGLKNRHEKPDTESVTKYLWWINKTNCQALLLEMCFIDNPEDMKIFSDHQKIAQAIYEGVCDIFKIKIVEQEKDSLLKMIFDFQKVLNRLKKLSTV